MDLQSGESILRRDQYSFTAFPCHTNMLKRNALSSLARLIVLALSIVRLFLCHIQDVLNPLNHP